jgi:hypothetical protein
LVCVQIGNLFDNNSIIGGLLLKQLVGHGFAGGKASSLGSNRSPHCPQRRIHLKGCRSLRILGHSRKEGKLKEIVKVYGNHL